MTTVHFFPTPIDGELLYSITMRYHRLSAYGSIRQTLGVLFGTGVCNVQSVLPKHLGFFFKEVGHHFWSSEDELASNHTLFPICRFFLPPVKLRDIESAINDSTTRVRAPATTSGLSAQGRQRGALRFCSVCRKDDEKNFGIALWWRGHQVPGVVVCWRHNLRLCEACAKCGEFCIPPSGKLLPPPARCYCGEEFNSIDAPHRLEALHARLAEDLLITSPAFVDIKTRRSCYQARLRELGVISNGPFHWEKIKRALDEIWRTGDEKASRRTWTSHSYGTESASKLISGCNGFDKERFRAVELKIIASLFNNLDEFLSYARTMKLTSVAISKKRNRTPKEWENEVLGRLAAGESISAVATACRVPFHYPKLLLHRRGEPLPNSTPPVDVQRLNLLLGELAKGYSLAKIARQLNVPPKTLWL